MSTRDNEKSIDGASLAGVLAHQPVERLREMGRALGPEVPCRIIELFLGDVPTRLASLRQSLVAGDAEAMEGTAHSLKGSSANLGASDLADLCDDIERRCRGSLPADAEQRLEVLEAEYGRVELAMRELLAEFA